MSADTAYVDTSALAKWYLPEPGSEAFVEFIVRHDGAVISRLTSVELLCLLARRRRAGDITAEHERNAWLTFEDDIRAGHLRVEALADGHALRARALLERVRDLPLRTLDALHLAIAQSIEAGVLATADLGMARAARALGFTVVAFGRGSLSTR
ncbi:MAG: type II toxin-antitoxin system VapC family toxin [Geminicoccaceae bacterium]